jgi:UDP-N-acetylglucosamine 2-epimerase (non-hydrolysing)
MGIKKIIEIAGARPNFMKVAPIHRELSQCDNFAPILIHTGQHYDETMSKVFFDDLQMPKPDKYLGIGSGTHAQQTGSVMIELEKILLEEHPDLVLVVGDVNSTLAAAITAAKLCLPVAHVEAGLRSFNMSMPEEINRLLTDSLSEFLFVTEESGITNLQNEGIADNKIHFVGNVMIDSLIQFRSQAGQSSILETIGLEPDTYALLTLHRPSNVDDPENFNKILQALEKIQTELPIIFPIHPRTRKQLSSLDLENRIESMPFLVMVDPLGYLDFLKLMMEAKLVLTDSGGIQEETTFLNIPCLTLRKETERPITVEQGTNSIVGNDVDLIIEKARNIIDSDKSVCDTPPLWDGNTAKRILEVLLSNL